MESFIFLHKWNLAHKCCWLYFHKQIASFYSNTGPDPHQFSSLAQLCPTLCNPMDCSMPGFPVLHCLPELAQTHVHWVGEAIHHLILCCSLLLLPSIFPSTRVFSNRSDLHIKWPKHWSFSVSIHPSDEYSELIFRIDWFDFLAVQATLKSLLQYHSSKASITRCSVFFMVQLSHPYMTSGKTIAWTILTFVTTETFFFAL